MGDVLVIVPPGIAAGFHLAGARVWPAEDAPAAQRLLLLALEDPDAGVIALAEGFYAALDGRTRQAVERRRAPVVVPVPTHAAASPEELRRAYLTELIRRAVGVKVVLGRGHERR